MIDLHNHILPNVDDGACGLHETIEMLQIAVKDGIHTIIATPHYCVPRYRVPQKIIQEKVRQINNLAKQHGLPIEIFPGREMMLDTTILNTIKQEVTCTLAGTDYMLIELPMYEWKDYYRDIIYELHVMGYVPILAHAERYPYFWEEPSKINDLLQEGVLIQINSGSVLGMWGKTVQKTTRTFLKHGIVQFIGSDAHNSKERPPTLSKAVSVINKIQPCLGERLLFNGELLIMNKEVVSNSEKITLSKSIWDFLRRK